MGTWDGEPKTIPPAAGGHATGGRRVNVKSEMNLPRLSSLVQKKVQIKLCWLAKGKRLTERVGEHAGSLVPGEDGRGVSCWRRGQPGKMAGMGIGPWDHVKVGAIGVCIYDAAAHQGYLEMMKHFGFLLMAALAASCSMVRAQAPSPAQAPAFQKGDRVCFLGDSIFHGGKIHSDLLLFYATRFPDAPMMFFNAGVAGDMTNEATRRLAWDVRPDSPTVTVIMFGMNDVGRWLFGQDNPSAAVLDQRKSMMAAHVKSMDQIVGELKQMGSRVIICTPTPFDQTVINGTANAQGVDDALGLVAENAKRLAMAGKYGLVDFHGQMNRVLHEQQAKAPSFTMMDPSRVHPEAAGHLVMTYIFLKAQGVSPTVSRVVVDARAGRLASAENCRVSEVAKRGGGLSFKCEAKSLPYPIEDNEKAVLGWVPLMDEFNREMLQVQNLEAEDYEVLIDGQSVGVWPAGELGKGVNLAGNVKTPQYKQAAAVMELNEKRRNRESETLRIFAALEHDVLRPKRADTTDMTAVRAAMEKAIEEEGRTQSWRHQYFINLSKVYYAQKPRQKEIETELADMTARMFEMARPQAHQYAIRPKAAQ